MKERPTNQTLPHDMLQPLTRSLRWKLLESSAQTKWALLVVNAVGAKILYGLESSQLTDDDYRRLNAFRQRGLRRSLGSLPSYLDRAATNRSVLDAEEKASGRQGGRTNFGTSSNIIKHEL